MRGNLLTAAALTAAITLGAAGCKTGGHDDHDEDSTEVVITPNDVPAPVKRGFDKLYPNVVVKKIERETYKDGTIHYEFEFVGADGKKQEVEFDDKGEVLPDH